MEQQQDINKIIVQLQQDVRKTLVESGLPISILTLIVSDLYNTVYSEQERYLDNLNNADQQQPEQEQQEADAEVVEE